MRVTVDHLEKRYRDSSNPTLKNLSLGISEGEKVVILGLNGAGKTTLLKCILGLLAPDKGTIKINDSGDIRQQRKHIGVVSQYSSFDRRLTIKDNIIYHAYLYGIKKKSILSTLHEMAEDFGFSKNLDDRPSKLSGGTLRKAVLVRSLIASPDIVIMDEPTANVDPQYRKVLQRYLDTVTLQGGAALLSTHIRDDIIEAKNASIYLLEQGLLREISPEEVEDFFYGAGGVANG